MPGLLDSIRDSVKEAAIVSILKSIDQRLIRLCEAVERLSPPAEEFDLDPETSVMIDEFEEEKEKEPISKSEAEELGEKW